MISLANELTSECIEEYVERRSYNDIDPGASFSSDPSARLAATLFSPFGELTRDCVYTLLFVELLKTVLIYCYYLDGGSRVNPLILPN